MEYKEKDIQNVQEAANIHKDVHSITSEELNENIKEEIRSDFHIKYPDSNFDSAWFNFEKIKPFNAINNINETPYAEYFTKETHYIMRLIATWHINKALKALKFDTENDPNLQEEVETGNIGTSGRIAKIWGGNGLDPENLREFGEGRWTKMPRLATFPAKEKDTQKPVTIVIDNPGIGSVCSHHFLPYSITKEHNSKIVISYIPKEKLLGLSKIGRFVEWCLNRPSLQEESTELIYNILKDVTGTEDIYVGLIGLSHSCETTRGAKQNSSTSTEEYGGAFSDPVLRDSISKYH